MMKTHEKTKWAMDKLEICRDLLTFDPLTGETFDEMFLNQENRDLYDAIGLVVDYIQQLERDNAQKDERIRGLEREMEALINIVKRSDTVCLHCKHFCYVCTRPSKEIRLNGDCFEWRGVEEDANES